LRREPGLPGGAVPGGAAPSATPLNTGLMASFTAGSRAAEDGEQADPTPSLSPTHQHRSTEGPSS
ncbi:hypothetical protein, partial [Streptomyces phytophilus]|uniref:hypothetical protein n=1 Tax=Streptomyces phytophilus TaxID=722715 RepID=UPI001C692CAC